MPASDELEGTTGASDVGAAVVVVLVGATVASVLVSGASVDDG